MTGEVGPEAVTETQPRIYVASLSDYNAGIPPRHLARCRC